MRDPFRLIGSIGTATMLCLMAMTAPQADDKKSREIIETDFAPTPAPLSGDGQSYPPSDPELPAAQPSLVPVPVELIGELQPLDPYLGPDGSSDGGVASSGGAGTAGNGLGGAGSGGVGSGGAGSGSEGSGGGGLGGLGGGLGGLADGLGGLAGALGGGVGSGGSGGGDDGGGAKGGKD